MDTPNEMKIEIKVDESIAEGRFANFSNVSVSPEEFVVDFLAIHPSPPPGFGKLQSRIVMTPAHAKRLMEALDQSVREYEENFGDIGPFHEQASVTPIQ